MQTPELRREELLDAAEHWFLKKGIAATSVDDIVAKVGVAKGTFYLSFPSKEALLVAVQERFVAAFSARQRAAMEHYRADQWHERLRASLQAGIEGYLDQVRLHDVLFHEHRPHDRQGMSNNQVVVEFTAFLRAGHEAGAWRVTNPRLTAVMLFHALHGAVDHAIAEQPDISRIDRQRLASAVGDFAQRALG